MIGYLSSPEKQRKIELAMRKKKRLLLKLKFFA